MSLDQVTLHIEPLDEALSFSIVAPVTATFLELKQMSQQKTRVAVDRHVIFPKDGQGNWEDGNTHKEWQLNSKFFMDASRDIVSFTVEGSEEVVKFKLHLPQSATILQLRERIQQFTGVALDRQIIFDKETRWLWLDFRTVKECGYTSCGTIFLLVLPLPLGAQLCINIFSWAAEFQVTVQENDRVSDLKKKIRIERKFSPEKRITLFHLFTEMHDDDDPLYKYYVNEGSTITMTHG